MKNVLATVKKASLAVAVSAMSLFVGSSASYAESAPTALLSQVQGVRPGGDLLNIVINMMNFAITLIALVAVAFLVWNGVQYIMAGGDEGKVEKATKGITNAIIGLVICFLSVVIVNFVVTKIFNIAG